MNRHESLQEQITRELMKFDSNFEDVEYGDSKPDEWYRLIDEMESGKTVKIHDSVWWYFLEVLPPRRMGHNWFVFAEGDDKPKLFGGCSEDARWCKQFDSYAELNKCIGDRKPVAAQ